MDEDKIREIIRALFVKDTKSEDISDTTEVLLSSLQILNMLALVEKKFGIEIEDELIFHGLFSSVESLSAYVMKSME